MYGCVGPTSGTYVHVVVALEIDKSYTFLDQSHTVPRLFGKIPVELLILATPPASKLLVKTSWGVEFNTAETGNDTAPTVCPIPIVTRGAIGISKLLSVVVLADRLPLYPMLTLLRGVPRGVPWGVHRGRDVPGGGGIGTRGVQRLERDALHGSTGGSMPLIKPFSPKARSI